MRTWVWRQCITAAAGGRGGSWFALLEGLARLIHEVCPVLTVAVVEGGGVLNHALVGAGQLPMADLNPPMIRPLPWLGCSLSKRPSQTCVLAWRNLTTNYLQCMVDHACPVHTLPEWLQGRALRVPVDRVGTVDRMVFD